MFKNLTLAAAALTMGTVALAPTADAQRYGDRYDRGYSQRDYRDNGYRNYDRRNNNRRYNYNQRCSSGTTGTIVGAIAGGLLGRTIDSRGDRTLGTVLGGVGGAVAGNAIEKSNNSRRCR